MKKSTSTGAKPNPATHPAVVAEHQRMLAKRLMPAGLSVAKRVEFTGITPMHQPVYARLAPQLFVLAARISWPSQAAGFDMGRATCRQAGCNYPEGGCSGACAPATIAVGEPLDSDLDLPDRTPDEEERSSMRGLAIALLITTIGCIAFAPFIISLFKP